MNILDENIPESQRQALLDWGIPVRQIGLEVGYDGMKDDAIIPLLHQLQRPTFSPWTGTLTGCTSRTLITV